MDERYYSDIYYKRELLYERVWTEPITKVATKYQVSDVTIGKICRKMKIPLPPVGYWLKANKEQKPALPEYKDYPTIRVRRDYRKRISAEPILCPDIFTKAEVLIAQEKKNNMQITAPKEVNEYHNFVKNTRKCYEKNKTRYRTQDYGRTKSSGIDTFIININPENLDRASIILQALCTAFDERGYKLDNKYEITDRDNYLAVEIFKKKIAFQIFEPAIKKKIGKKDKESYSYRDIEYAPTGELVLEIIYPPYDMLGQKKWRDTKRKKLEDQLNRVLIGLIAAAAWEVERDARLEVLHAKHEKDEQKRKIEASQNRINNRRINEFENGFVQWRKYNELFEYVSYIKQNSKPDDPEDFRKWLIWADDYLESLNPMKSIQLKFDVEDPEAWRLK